MPYRVKASVAAALFFTGAIPFACGQIATPAALPPVGPSATWAAAPVPLAPTVSDPSAIFPLAQVRRGLRGIAWTVFEGTQPEPVQVEILGLLHDAIGPGQDMILARLHGEKPEYTGVVAGMSGSPVYIDGKLLGALSYRIGQFTREPIAGITPIEQMLQVRNLGATPSIAAGIQSLAKSSASPHPSEPQFSERQPSSLQSSKFETQQASPSSTTGGRAGIGSQAEARSPLGRDESPSLLEIEAPLVFDGFSAQTLQLFGDRFTSLGLMPVAGLGGASPESKQPEPIVPGSAVSAVLVRGDLSIAATCTVTYVDPKQLLACGHPITQFGSVSMPMTKADVVLTLASPLNSFKIINTTETVGTFTQDRMNAIYGRFGQLAKMIPVTVTISAPHSSTNPDAAAQARTLHFEVLNNPKLTPQLVLVSVYQALQGTNSSAEEQSYRMSGTLEIADHSPVEMDALLAPTEQFPASIAAALLLNERFGRVYDNDLQQPDIRSLNLTFEPLPERLTSTLDSARLSTNEARPGDTITVEATLHPYHGPARILRIPVVLPASLTPGTLRLLVSDAAVLDRLLQPAPYVNQRPAPLDETIAELNRQHANDRLYVTLLEHSPQAVLQNQALPALPLSMANVLQPLRDTQQLSLTAESAVTLASAPADSVPNGSQALSLTIR